MEDLQVLVAELEIGNIREYLEVMRELAASTGSKSVVFDVQHAQIAGANHLDAVRALEPSGFKVVWQGKHIVMTRSPSVPRQ